MPTPEIKCGGIDLRAFDRPIVPEVEYPKYDDLINAARLKFVKDHPSSEWGNAGIYYPGTRFKSNRDVMVRIVSACPTRDYFEGNRTAWIVAGLDQCAQADHWYQYEKDWGTEDVSEEVEDEDDDESDGNE